MSAIDPIMHYICSFHSETEKRAFLIIFEIKPLLILKVKKHLIRSELKSSMPNYLAHMAYNCVKVIFFSHFRVIIQIIFL